MTAIVLNTLSGAVTEYAGLPFDSLTPTHAAGPGGLYALGGDTDAGAPIVARAMTGLQQWGNAKKKRVPMVYFALQGEGQGELLLGTPAVEHAYRFALQPSGESRCPPGKGVHENYLAFGFSNPDGETFTLDRIEALVALSATRRA